MFCTSAFQWFELKFDDFCDDIEVMVSFNRCMHANKTFNFVCYKLIKVYYFTAGENIFSLILKGKKMLAVKQCFITVIIIKSRLTFFHEIQSSL